MRPQLLIHALAGYVRQRRDEALIRRRLRRYVGAGRGAARA